MTAPHSARIRRHLVRGLAGDLPHFVAVVPGPGLLFGLILLAAILGGFTARMVQVPRVVGYLLAGLALRAALGRLVAPVEGGIEALAAAAEPLLSINDLALGIILFTIGGVFERSQVKAAGGQALKIGILEMGFVLVFTLLGCGAITILTQSEHGVAANLTLAALLATAAIATAPAATLVVLREYGAKGPITQMILTVVGLNNIVCILVFTATFLGLAATGALETDGPLSRHLGMALLLTLVGSLVAGLLFGTLICIAHAKLALPETSLVFFAAFILLGAGEKWLLEHQGLSYNFLLTALVIGAVFYNVGIDTQKLENALRSVAMPILAGFFVMAGYNLHLSELVHLGWVGAAYVLARTAGKYLGARLGLRWSGEEERLPKSIGSALLCQAAVVIGLAAFVSQHWKSPLATQFGTVILGSVVLFELTGPLLIKRCVVKGGEVKAITLLRRAGPATGSSSAVRLTIASLFRVVAKRHDRPLARDTGPLAARHIMRRNVQFLRASAPLDEVLHFIERSTYDHFPVMDEDGHYVGTIHFADVRDVIYDPLLRDLVTAFDLADQDAPLVPVDLPLTELLALFTQRNVGVLPVGTAVGDREVIGIVEQRDLLQALHLSVRT